MTIPIVPQFKICTQCGEKFPATTEYFHKMRGGLLPTCKTCKNAYNARYYAEHLEEARVYQARYRAEHPEYDAHYRAQKPEKVRAAQARWHTKNPEARKVLYHRRLARKQELPNTLTAQEWQTALNYFGGGCAYCGKTEDFWTQVVPDHWIALSDSRADNPGTVATNIIPACHARKGVPTGEPCCNNSKGNKDPAAWLIEKFGKRKAKQISARIEAYFTLVRAPRTD